MTTYACIGAVIIEKFDTEQLKKQLCSKAELLFRARSKLVKVMGKYYYKKMDEIEFQHKFNKFCQVIDDGIHTEQQLADFMAKE